MGQAWVMWRASITAGISAIAVAARRDHWAASTMGKAWLAWRASITEVWEWQHERPGQLGGGGLRGGAGGGKGDSNVASAMNQADEARWASITEMRIGAIASVIVKRDHRVTRAMGKAWLAWRASITEVRVSAIAAMVEWGPEVASMMGQVRVAWPASITA